MPDAPVTTGGIDPIPVAPPERPPRKKRSPTARFFGFLSRVVGMFERGTGKDRKFSMIRVMLACSMCYFLERYPNAAEWTKWNAIVLLGHFAVLPLETLFYAVPLGELMKGAQANLGGWAMKGAVAVKERVSRLANESPPSEPQPTPPTSMKVEMLTGTQPPPEGGVGE